MLSHNTRERASFSLVELILSMVRAVRASQVEIEAAVQALRDGELVAFPDRDRLRPRRERAEPGRGAQDLRGQGASAESSGDRAPGQPALPAPLGARGARGRQPPGRELLARAAHHGDAARAARARRDHRRPGHDRDPRARAPDGAAAADRLRRRHRRPFRQPLRPPVPDPRRARARGIRRGRARDPRRRGVPDRAGVDHRLLRGRAGAPAAPRQRHRRAAARGAWARSSSAPGAGLPARAGRHADALRARAPR